MAMACTASVASPSSFCAPLRASPSTRSNFFSGTTKLNISNGASLPAMENSITIECSSRPQKKCTAHHNKTRPKKHNLSDKNRKRPVYPKPPPPPPIITLGWADEGTPAVAEA